MHGPWRCDECGQLIYKPKDGSIQWLDRITEAGIASCELKIVHHQSASPLSSRTNGCDLDAYDRSTGFKFVLADHRLSTLSDADCLVRLLELAATGRIPTPEVNRVIMRLLVSNYERARPYFEDAVSQEVVVQTLEDDYFYESDLRTILDHFEESDESP